MKKYCFTFLTIALLGMHQQCNAAYKNMAEVVTGLMTMVKDIDETYNEITTIRDGKRVQFFTDIVSCARKKPAERKASALCKSINCTTKKECAVKAVASIQIILETISKDFLGTDSFLIQMAELLQTSGTAQSKSQATKALTTLQPIATNLNTILKLLKSLGLATRAAREKREEEEGVS